MLSTTIAAVLSSILLAQVAAADEASALLRRANRYWEPLPATMPGAETDTPAKIALGKRLFFEKRLSVNDEQACGSCHRLEDGGAGVDNLSTSPGARGQFGNRNTPTVLNAGWQFAQFWDGRAPDLVEQAKEPILNPIEMGMPNETAVEQKLRGIPEYVQAFSNVFPDSSEPVTYQNMAEAIAAFERTLRTEDRLDDFLNGDLTALSESEQRGLKTFIKINCVKCHDGPLIGGGAFERLGEKQEYENQADLGRYEVTKDESDKMFFKVPSLRNVALTAPYFHDGRVETLDEAVRTMAKLQLDRQLSDEQVKDIVSFLRALSDKRRVASQ